MRSNTPIVLALTAAILCCSSLAQASSGQPLPYQVSVTVASQGHTTEAFLLNLKTNKTTPFMAEENTAYIKSICRATASSDCHAPAGSAELKNAMGETIVIVPGEQRKGVLGALTLLKAAKGVPGLRVKADYRQPGVMKSFTAMDATIPMPTAEAVDINEVVYLQPGQKMTFQGTKGTSITLNRKI